MRTIVVVETPLQLLNAVEAKAALGLDDCVVVIFVSSAFPAAVFAPLLPLAQWTAVEFLALAGGDPPAAPKWLGERLSARWREYLSELAHIARRRKLDALVARLQSCDNLVIGNLLAGHMQHVVNRLPARDVYLLDDGTDTLRVNANLQRPAGRLPARRPSLIQQAKLAIRRRLSDWDETPPRAVTFFTSFDLDTRPADRSVRNDYAYLRAHRAGAARPAVVYFLGQPLAEDGYVTAETYRARVRQIAHAYRAREFTYVMHRREDPRNVDLLREHGISVTRLDLPVEVHMLTVEKPGEIASFFSSALDNSRIIFGDGLRISAFRVPESDLIDGHRFVSDVYAHLMRYVGPSFHVVELDPLPAAPAPLPRVHRVAADDR